MTLAVEATHQTLHWRSVQKGTWTEISFSSCDSPLPLTLSPVNTHKGTDDTRLQHVHIFFTQDHEPIESGSVSCGVSWTSLSVSLSWNGDVGIHAEKINKYSTIKSSFSLQPAKGHPTTLQTDL